MDSLNGYLNAPISLRRKVKLIKSVMGCLNMNSCVKPQANRLTWYLVKQLPKRSNTNVMQYENIQGAWSSIPHLEIITRSVPESWQIWMYMAVSKVLCILKIQIWTVFDVIEVFCYECYSSVEQLPWKSLTYYSECS